MKFSLWAAMCIWALESHAAGEQEGIIYYKCGMPEPAKKILLDEVAQGEADWACCYYLGEIYAGEQKADSALFFYRKGLAQEADQPLCVVGEGKLFLKTDVRKAEDLFARALSGKNKKNPEVLLAIARAYAGEHSAQAETYLQRAKEADPHLAEVYVLAGDLLAARNQNGDACSNYEQAIYFNPACIEAYVKYARIYSGTNPQAGLDMLQKLQAVDTTGVIAAREMAEIYYATSRYGEAIPAFEKIIDSKYCTVRELVRYATVLYHQGKFDRSLSMAEKVLAKNPDHVVVRRIMMYDLYELKRYEEGLKAGEQFFKASSSTDCIAQDYIFYGRLLLAAKQVEAALPELRKGLSLDSGKVEVYKDIAKGYEKLNRYDSAIVYYSDFLRKGEEKVTMADWFMVGKFHYFASDTPDTTVSAKERRLVHLVAADSIFGYVAEKIPDHYLGNFWRARVNSALDPETEKGLARPYYEAAQALLEKDGKAHLRMLVECYSYLGYYHYLKNEITESKTYWSKILALEPENEVAKKALDGMK